ncbi:MAG: prolipoprotein diacylglyceryl transferase [Clostridiales bacterium]|nr:prolipoprotein diacylglyceryl transferase [Clostridiales bacterium]
MFPELDLGFISIDMYTVMIIIGLIAAMAMFAYLAKANKLPDFVYRKYMQIALLAAIAGFLSAVLFQSIYDFLKTGKFEFGGMTFIGGLIGGIGAFFLLFAFMADEEEKKYLRVCANFLLISIVVAHFFGRIGCFLAGCCYGKLTDSFLGVNFPDIGHRHPTQLYEAALLLAIFLACLKFKNQTIYIYPISYGVGRFVIEFFRGDDRGAFFFNVLSPSQFWSILMAIGGVVLIFVLNRKKEYKTE